MATTRRQVISIAWSTRGPGDSVSLTSGFEADWGKYQKIEMLSIGQDDKRQQELDLTLTDMWYEVKTSQTPDVILALISSTLTLLEATIKSSARVLV